MCALTLQFIVKTGAPIEDDSSAIQGFIFSLGECNLHAFHRQSRQKKPAIMTEVRCWMLNDASRTFLNTCPKVFKLNLKSKQHASDYSLRNNNDMSIWRFKRIWDHSHDFMSLLFFSVLDSLVPPPIFSLQS